jgi:hypothetical protein
MFAQGRMDERRLANKTAMGLDKMLSQLMDCPLPTNNTHIIMSTKIAHTQI